MCLLVINIDPFFSFLYPFLSLGCSLSVQSLPTNARRSSSTRRCGRARAGAGMRARRHDRACGAAGTRAHVASMSERNAGGRVRARAAAPASADPCGGAGGRARRLTRAHAVWAGARGGRRASAAAPASARNDAGERGRAWRSIDDEHLHRGPPPMENASFFPTVKLLFLTDSIQE